MMGRLVRKRSECSCTVRYNTSTVEHTADRRPRPRTGEGQGLNMEYSIAMLEAGQFNGKRERCHEWLISLVVNRKRRCLKTVVAQGLK